jgi:hypothetical protein
MRYDSVCRIIVYPYNHTHGGALMYFILQIGHASSRNEFSDRRLVEKLRNATTKCDDRMRFFIVLCRREALTVFRGRGHRYTNSIILKDSNNRILNKLPLERKRNAQLSYHSSVFRFFFVVKGLSAIGFFRVLAETLLWCTFFDRPGNVMVII